MKISTSTNILCERTDGNNIPMQESIIACAHAGFTQLDFGFAELAFHSPQFLGDDWAEEIETCGKLAHQHGITFVQGHGTIFDFCKADSDYHQQLNLLHRSIDGAQMLGIPWLVVHPSSHLEDGILAADTHRLNVEFFQQIASYAHRMGVGIAIENMWGEACPGVPRYAITAQEVLCLIEDIDMENVGVCWDVEHASIENLPQGASIRLLGNHIKVTHLSDETGANNIHVLPYTGFVKWDEVLDAFADIDYAGTFSLEIQHYLPAMPQALWSDAMRLAHSVGSHLVEELDRKRATRKTGRPK